MKHSVRQRLLRPKLGKKSRWLLIVIIVIGPLLYYAVHKMNSPANGTISVPRTDNPVVHTDSTDYSTLSTPYVSLLYPSQFSQDYHSDPGGTLLYKYFTIPESDASLEIYIKPLPTGGITLDGDYKLYAADKRYKASNKLHNTDVVDVFAKDDDGQERNVLWEHGGYLLIIKLHGVVEDQDIDQQIKTITNSVQWLKQ